MLVVMSPKHPSHLSHPKHPKFEPLKWRDKYTRMSHNCHMYALNAISPQWISHCKKNLNTLDNRIQCHRPQIGYFTNASYENTVIDYGKNNKIDKRGFTARTLRNRFLRDHEKVFELDPEEDCPYGYYRVFLFATAPVVGDSMRYTGFHFFREDRDGTWSQKDGDQPVEGGVHDVRTLILRSRLTTDEIAGYFAVPVDECKYVKKNISDSLK